MELERAGDGRVRDAARRLDGREANSLTSYLGTVPKSLKPLEITPGNPTILASAFIISARSLRSTENAMF